MAKTSPTTSSIAVPGNVANKAPQGAQVTVFQRGAQLFEDTPLGSEVYLKFDDDTLTKVVVQNSQVGALIDLISSYGPQSIYTYGQPYSARGLVAALSGGEVLDVTKLYTVVTVMVPYQMPGMPTA